MRTQVAPAYREPVLASKLYQGSIPAPDDKAVRVMSNYRDRLANYGTFRRKAEHSGIDFATARHNIAIATADGAISRISSAFNSFGCGNGVSIRHGDAIYSTYCHLESVADLAVGDRVRRGDIIGTVGSTGLAPREFPHVHFEVTNDGLPHDEGDLANTRDPADHFGGCYRGNDVALPANLLTYPVPCETGVSTEKALGVLSVRTVQKRLTGLGFAAGAADGKLGPKTIAAIRVLQGTNGLQQSGRLDRETESLLLRLSNAQRLSDAAN